MPPARPSYEARMEALAAAFDELMERNDQLLARDMDRLRAGWGATVGPILSESKKAPGAGLWATRRKELRQVLRDTQRLQTTFTGVLDDVLEAERGFAELLGQPGPSDSAAQRFREDFAELLLDEGAKVEAAARRAVLTGDKALVDAAGRALHQATRRVDLATHELPMSLSREQAQVLADHAGAERFRYFGPKDSVNRAFCRERIGKVYSRQDIEAMDNGHGLDVRLHCGGWRCRHHWRAVWSPDGPSGVASALAVDAPVEEMQPQEVEESSEPEPQGTRSVTRFTRDSGRRGWDRVERESKELTIEQRVAASKERFLSRSAMFRRAEKMRQIGRVFDKVELLAPNVETYLDTLLEEGRAYADEFEQHQRFEDTPAGEATRAAVRRFAALTHKAWDGVQIPSLRYSGRSGRGYFHPGLQAIHLGEDGAEESELFQRRVVQHETGHALELAQPLLEQGAKEFLLQGVDRERTLINLTEGLGGAPEWAVDGRFANRYANKVYLVQGVKATRRMSALDLSDIDATEVTSVALEHFNFPTRAAELYIHDPDLFWWGIHVLEGGR